MSNPVYSITARESYVSNDEVVTLSSKDDIITLKNKSVTKLKTKKENKTTMENLYGIREDC